jgi:cell wall assembly regulator SMI1
MNELLDRLDVLLEREAAPVFQLLRPPATWEKLDATEQELGFELPADVRLAYRWHDGQEYHGMPQLPGLFGAFAWTSLDHLVRCWRDRTEMLNDLRSEDPTLDETVIFSPEQKVQFAIWTSRWIPVGDRRGGPLLCVDMEPGPSGCKGQLIRCSLDNPDANVQIAVNLEAHFQDLIQRLESERFRFSASKNTWVESATDAVVEDFGYW